MYSELSCCKPPNGTITWKSTYYTRRGIAFVQLPVVFSSSRPLLIYMSYSPPPYPAAEQARGRKDDTAHNAYPRPPHGPRSRLASCISFVMSVTRFAWIAQRFESSNRCTRKASVASCSARIADDCHRSSPALRDVRLRATSRTWKLAFAWGLWKHLESRVERKGGRSKGKLTTRLKGSLAISKSVLFWYFLISCSATVPGRKRRFFCGAAAPEPSPLPVCQLCRRPHVSCRDVALVRRCVRPPQQSEEDNTHVSRPCRVLDHLSGGMYSGSGLRRGRPRGWLLCAPSWSSSRREGGCDVGAGLVKRVGVTSEDGCKVGQKSVQRVRRAECSFQVTCVLVLAEMHAVGWWDNVERRNQVCCDRL